MGNCANKPTTAEGEAPAPEEKAVESTEREIVLETKVISADVDAHHITTPRSLAQMLEDEEKKAEVEATKPAEEKKEEAKPAEPAKAEASEPKKEEAKPAEVAAPAQADAPPAEKKTEEKK